MPPNGVVGLLLSTPVFVTLVESLVYSSSKLDLAFAPCLIPFVN